MPYSVSDLDLHLLAADALDPECVLPLRARLQSDPELARRFQAVCDAGPGLPPPARAWRIPPPGVGLAARLVRARALGQGARVRIGSVFGVCLPPPPDPDGVGVVLLRQGANGWEVSSPSRPDQAESLAAVGRRDQDEYRVDLVAHLPVGRQRWAIALHPLPLPVGPRHDPWAPLQHAVERGAVVVGSVEVDVCER